MITREQALTANMFHDIDCRTWRRNGQTQTWKTRPDHFCIPVKYGLYRYGQITHQDAGYVHIPGSENCRASK